MQVWSGANMQIGRAVQICTSEFSETFNSSRVCTTWSSWSLSPSASSSSPSRNPVCHEDARNYDEGRVNGHFFLVQIDWLGKYKFVVLPSSSIFVVLFLLFKFGTFTLIMKVRLTQFLGIPPKFSGGDASTRKYSSDVCRCDFDLLKWNFDSGHSLRYLSSLSLFPESLPFGDSWDFPSVNP